MADKIPFGIGTTMFLNIDTNGAIYTSTVGYTSYDSSTRVITLAANIAYTDAAIGDYVVFNQVNVPKNKFAFGKIVTLTTIALDDEADDSWVSGLSGGTDTLKITKGIVAGLFMNVNVTCTSTPVEFKGTNRFTREVAYTDGEAKVTVEEFILNTSALDYLNGLNTKAFGSTGTAYGVMDNQFGFDATTGKILPNDVKIVIGKAKTGEPLKYEEIIIERAKTATLSLPFNRNNFVAVNYEFEAQTKSLADSTLLTYTVEV